MQKEYTRFSLFILSAIFIFMMGCKSMSTDDPTTYFRHIFDKKNGLFQEKTVGNYTFSLQYKPSTYMVLADNENFPLTQESLVEQEKEYETLQYYTFRIKVASDTQHLDIITYNLSSEQEYNERIHYLETEMQQDIYLVCDKDTSKATSFIYDKSSDLNDYSSFLITFPPPSNPYADRKFVFIDKKFNSSIILFTIEASAISNAPTFKL